MTKCFETIKTKQRNKLTSRTRAKQSETNSDSTQGAAQFPKIFAPQPRALCSRNFFPFFEKNEGRTRENEKETAENGTGNGDSGEGIDGIRTGREKPNETVDLIRNAGI